MAITQYNLEFHTRNNFPEFMPSFTVHGYVYLSRFLSIAFNILQQSKKLKSRDLLINKTFKLEQQFKIILIMDYISSRMEYNSM